MTDASAQTSTSIGLGEPAGTSTVPTGRPMTSFRVLAIDVDGDLDELVHGRPSTGPAPPISHPPDPGTPMKPAANPDKPAGSGVIAATRHLQAWAAEGGVADDPYVVALSTAATSGADLHALASLDPLDALPHAEPSGGRGLRNVSRLLTVIRNVAIFVPVALTWFGIREATEAFGHYSASAGSKVDAQLNFLQFWQAGGPVGGPIYLSSAWRIQNIALLASAIILLVVVLTLVAGAVGARSQALDARRQLLAEQRRVAVAVDLVAALRPRRQADPASIPESLATSIVALVAASTSIAESAHRLERATSGLGSMVPHVDELNRQFERLGADVVSRVTQAVEALGQSVTALGTTVRTDMAASLDDAVAGLDDVREQLARTSASVEFGTKRLRDDLDAIHGGLAPAGSDEGR